jgi:hypothetical protein
MNLAIISAWNSHYSSLADFTIPNREAYCQRHGYTAISEKLDDPGGRHPLWGKLHLATKHLQDYDWLWMFDTDAIITQPSFTPTWLAGPEDLFATSDFNGFNSSSIFIRNTPWSHDVLRKWWVNGERFPLWACPEQTSLCMLLATEPKEKWACLKQRVCNSYLYNVHGEHWPDGQWQPGDFILHIPSLPINRRIEIFNETIRHNALLAPC